MWVPPPHFTGASFYSFKKKPQKIFLLFNFPPPPPPEMQRGIQWTNRQGKNLETLRVFKETLAKQRLEV